MFIIFYIRIYTILFTTELQLAGYLGKTLLDRNNDLEAKLKRLEEFTEETLHTNKVNYS